jgi:hypothetical protein
VRNELPHAAMPPAWWNGNWARREKCQSPSCLFETSLPPGYPDSIGANLALFNQKSEISG